MSRGGLAPWRAERVAAFVKAHLGENYRVERLAKVAHLSPSHFSRSFKKSFGTSPCDYIARQRVDYAQTLMLSSRQSLATIATDCGMADQSHLCVLFRRIVGVSPAQWRRRSSSSAASSPVAAAGSASRPGASFKPDKRSRRALPPSPRASF